MNSAVEAIYTDISEMSPASVVLQFCSNKLKTLFFFLFFLCFAQFVSK